MKAAEAIFVLCAVGAFLLWLIATQVVSPVSGAIRRSRNKHASWEVHLDPDRDGTCEQVYLRKEGEPLMLIGAVPVTLSHYEFEERLIELRLEAQDKANALNRRLSA